MSALIPLQPGVSFDRMMKSFERITHVVKWVRTATNDSEVTLSCIKVIAVCVSGKLVKTVKHSKGEMQEDSRPVMKSSYSRYHGLVEAISWNVAEHWSLRLKTNPMVRARETFELDETNLVCQLACVDVRVLVHDVSVLAIAQDVLYAIRYLPMCGVLVQIRSSQSMATVQEQNTYIENKRGNRNHKLQRARDSEAFAGEEGR